MRTKLLGILKLHNLDKETIALLSCMSGAIVPLNDTYLSVIAETKLMDIKVGKQGEYWTFWADMRDNGEIAFLFSQICDCIVDGSFVVNGVDWILDGE